jgi:hypothetical protein
VLGHDRVDEGQRHALEEPRVRVHVVGEVDVERALGSEVGGTEAREPRSGPRSRVRPRRRRRSAGPRSRGSRRARCPGAST